MYIYRIIECFTSIIYMFISICGKPVFYGQLTEHLVQLCEPCYTCKLKITSNGKECSRQVPFSVQTSTYSNVFFCNIQLNLSDFPYLLTKRNKKKKKKKTGSRSCSVEVANVPSLIKFSQNWKKCLAFFLVLESTCGMLHACAHEL